MASFKSLSFQPSCSAAFMDKGYRSFWCEDAPAKAFADKIARKLEWKHRFALRAIREYKKFIYLGAVSDFVVPVLAGSSHPLQ